MQDDNNNAAPPKPRTALRIVRADLAAQNAAAVDAEIAANPAKPKSRAAQFMTAYADAIDRDIKLLLDL